MRVRVEFELPALPTRRARRIALAVIVALALALPGIALASHQFGDVPNSNPFHNDIAAIADAGVTGGCGGGNYCPKANVTREQMAAFMNRLGALSPTKTPVVNADKLDGLESGDLLLEAVSGSGTSLPTTLTPQYVTAAETITTTRPGRWLATKTVSFEIHCTNGSNNRYYYLMLDGVPIRTSFLLKSSSEPAFNGQLSGLTDYVFAAGPHTLSVGGQCDTPANYSGYSYHPISSSNVIVLPPSADPSS